MPKAPITNIIFGTMTLGYRGYGARVHDAATADAMLGTVSEFGHDQIDTCSDYGDGSCEQMLGDLRTAERFGIATRIHPGNFHGHEPENLKRVFKESLARLKTGKVKILYLVTRDSATPIASTLSAVQELHDEGLFEEFGVSNFQRMAGGGGIGNGRAPWMDKAERLPRNVQHDHACGRTGIIQMPRQLRHPFPCLQSAGGRRLQQEFWR
jgi:predicted aldo/keto reductase-like oxidoreductase